MDAESAIDALHLLLKRRGLTLDFQDGEILIHGPAHRVTESIRELVDRYDDDLWDWARREGLTDITLVCSWCGCHWKAPHWDATENRVCQACLAQFEQE
jgi:hypothetical protein